MKLYIQEVRTIGPFAQLPPEQLTLWRGNFPANASRRMTPLGLMLGEVCRELLRPQEEALVYATSYSEVSTLEKYLASFPSPSPALFQTCIHPGGIEQVLVQRQCSVRILLPLAGEDALVSRAVRLALSAVIVDGAASVVLCGGEELGDWLAGIRAASEVAFAYALRVDNEPEGAMGSLTWISDQEGGEPASGARFFSAIASRENSIFAWPDAGSVRLEWL